MKGNESENIKEAKSDLENKQLTYLDLTKLSDNILALAGHKKFGPKMPKSKKLQRFHCRHENCTGRMKFNLARDYFSHLLDFHYGKFLLQKL